MGRPPGPLRRSLGVSVPRGEGGLDFLAALADSPWEPVVAGGRPGAGGRAGGETGAGSLRFGHPAAVLDLADLGRAGRRYRGRSAAVLAQGGRFR